MRTRQSQPGQTGADEKHGVLEKAVTQLNAHRGRNVGEVERSGDPGTVQAHTQWIEGLAAAPQHQLPQQPLLHNKH